MLRTITSYEYVAKSGETLTLSLDAARDLRDALMRELGSTNPIGGRPQWEVFAVEGRKIDAIKEFRSQYKVSLKAAKDAVERLVAAIDALSDELVKQALETQKEYYERMERMERPVETPSPASGFGATQGER
jgi:hypothetical protein